MDVVDDVPAMGAVDEAAVAEAVGEGGRVKSGRPRETQQQKLARIKRELEAVPTEPGVYLWKDAAGEVIYVGKAKQLRARMRQYVNFQDDRAKIPLLVEAIDSFDYLVVDNEHEALVLEKNLINQYSPFFNADFKDNKSYPFIALTKGDAFPAIKYTREKHKSDTKYFGPFTDARAAREMIDIARRVVPLCAATCADWRGLTRALEKDPLAFLKRDARPCFDCHVGPRPRRLLRGRHAGGVRPERAAHRALPRRQPPRVRRRADGGNAGGRRRARLRAGGTAEGAHRHHQLACRQAARRVLARPVRRRRRVLPRGDRGWGERARHPRGPHRECQRVRLEPRHRRARPGPAAQLPHALLRHHHLHPARGDRSRAARGRRGHGGVAHGQARLGPRRQGALHARRRRGRRPIF